MSRPCHLQRLPSDKSHKPPNKDHKFAIESSWSAWVISLLLELTRPCFRGQTWQGLDKLVQASVGVSLAVERFWEDSMLPFGPELRPTLLPERPNDLKEWPLSQSNGCLVLRF